VAAMINKNEVEYGHILTIEDSLNSYTRISNQREVHRDTHGFSQALRSALREYPDTILVGEMRDVDTIRLALLAAEIRSIMNDRQAAESEKTKECNFAIGLAGLS
jgi:twitching motility protein PilT